MRILAGIALVTAALALTAATAVAAPASPRCGMVAFATQGEDGVFQIAAAGTSCRTARIVADAAKPPRFRTGDPSYTAIGFSCSGRSQQLGGHGKQVVVFRCVRHRSLVSFLRA